MQGSDEISCHGFEEQKYDLSTDGVARVRMLNSNNLNIKRGVRPLGPSRRTFTNGALANYSSFGDEVHTLTHTLPDTDLGGQLAVHSERRFPALPSFDCLRAAGDSRVFSAPITHADCHFTGLELQRE
jgi:hypothetical protein